MSKIPDMLSCGRSNEKLAVPKADPSGPSGLPGQGSDAKK